MTEWEKMQQGLLYHDSAKELEEKRQNCRRLCRAFSEAEGHAEKQREILQELLGAAGENLMMVADIHFDYGVNTYIGKNCFFNFHTTILDCAEVRFGDDVLVGPNSSFLTPLHPLDATERRGHPISGGGIGHWEYAKPITIGNDVWIGGSVTVNGGVTIGDGTVIASGSVVTRDIPSGVLAAGAPCRVLRRLTEEDRLFQDK